MSILPASSSCCTCCLCISSCCAVRVCCRCKYPSARPAKARTADPTGLPQRCSGHSRSPWRQSPYRDWQRVCRLNIAGKLCLCNGLLDLGERLGLRGGVAVQCVLIGVARADLARFGKSACQQGRLPQRFSAFEPPGLMLCMYALFRSGVVGLSLLHNIVFLTVQTCDRAYPPWP